MCLSSYCAIEQEYEVGCPHILALKEEAMQLSRLVLLVMALLTPIVSKVGTVAAVPWASDCYAYMGGYYLPVACPEATPDPTPSNSTQDTGIYGGNPPTNVPRDGNGRIIFKGEVWQTGSMTFERTRQEQDALWEWQHRNGYPPESIQDDLDLQDYLNYLASLDNPQHSPAEDESEQPAETEGEDQSESTSDKPSADQCAKWREQLTTAEKTAKSIARNLQEIDAAIQLQKEKLRQLEQQHSYLQNEEQSLLDDLKYNELELMDAQKEYRGETDREASILLLEKIVELRTEIARIKLALTAINDEIYQLEDKIRSDRKELSSLESDSNDLIAGAKYWLNEVDRLTRLLATCV